MKNTSQNKNQIVYKCNSRNCKDNGYHTKEDCRTITLKLTIGKNCPLDFEDQIVKTVEKAVEAKAEVVPSTPAPFQPTPQQVQQMKRRSAIPAGLIQGGLQMKPPADA